MPSGIKTAQQLKKFAKWLREDPRRTKVSGRVSGDLLRAAKKKAA
ncbi:MAG TPA: hypothetical protein VF194_04100 [Ferrovibrio sp.]